MIFINLSYVPFVYAGTTSNEFFYNLIYDENNYVLNFMCYC